MSNFGKILIFTILLLLLITFFKSIAGTPKQTEGFTQTEDYIFVKNVAVFDEFYSQLYDYLVFNEVKTDFEVGNVLDLLDTSGKISLLDVGSGTGHHVSKLGDNKLISDVVGIDISPAMIKMSKKRYPSHKWVLGDALDTSHFPPQCFTHITCFYFTIYYFKEKRYFFENCMKWLMPGGYLIIHLVNKHKFDPILPPGNPLYIVSPQRYAKKRITKTKITFSDFVYNSNFNVEGDVATFDEKFKFNNGKIRQQQQTLYMEDAEDIVTMAQQEGFNLHSVVDMIKCAYDNQYLYIFTKPA
jgi:SAM-dependent methyltransferase